MGLFFIIENSLPARTCSLLPSQLFLDHSHCLVLAPATLAALPSTRAISDRDVFYVAHPIRVTMFRSRVGEFSARLRNGATEFATEARSDHAEIELSAK